MTDTAPSLGQDKHSSHGESSRQNRKSAPLRPPHTGKGHHFLAMRLGFASPASTHKGRHRTNADITRAWNRRALKSLPPASFETFPRAWGRHQSAAACTPSRKTLSLCVEQAPSAEQAIPPDKRVTSARGANSMKIILLRNPKHVAPARGQPPRTQENPYPIYSRLLRVQPQHTENPFYVSSRLTLRRV